MLTDVVNGGIHKHTYTLALGGHIVRTFTDVATGLWPEDKAHQVDAKSFDLADVLSITHAADFDEWGRGGDGANGDHRANETHGDHGFGR